jgi:hypothetical protein
MIKINLLPAFVRERKIVRKLLMLVFVFLGLELLAFSYWYNRVSTEGYKVGQELDSAKAQAQEVQNLQNEAQNIRSEIEPIKAKTKFIEDTMNFPVKLADLLDSIRRYTYAKVIYTSLQLGAGGGMAGGGMMGMMGKGPMGGMPGSSGGTPPMMSGMPGMMGGGPGGGGQQITTVSIQGYTDSVEDVARYLQNILRCPKIADVQISGIPGYGTAAGAAPGMGGMPGTMGKGPMGGMPGMMGGMPGMMPPASSGMSSQAGGPINISVVCYLMEPLTPPSPPTAAAAAAPAPGMMPPMVGMGAPGALPQAGAPQAAPAAKAPSEGGALPGLGERRRMEREVMEEGL